MENDDSGDKKDTCTWTDWKTWVLIFLPFVILVVLLGMAAFPQFNVMKNVVSSDMLSKFIMFAVSIIVIAGFSIGINKYRSDDSYKKSDGCRNYQFLVFGLVFSLLALVFIGLQLFRKPLQSGLQRLLGNQ